LEKKLNDKYDIKGTTQPRMFLAFSKKQLKENIDLWIPTSDYIYNKYAEKDPEFANIQKVSQIDIVSFIGNNPSYFDLYEKFKGKEPKELNDILWWQKYIDDLLIDNPNLSSRYEKLKNKDILPNIIYGLLSVDL